MQIQIKCHSDSFSLINSLIAIFVSTFLHIRFHFEFAKFIQYSFQWITYFCAQIYRLHRSLTMENRARFHFVTNHISIIIIIFKKSLINSFTDTANR